MRGSQADGSRAARVDGTMRGAARLTGTALTIACMVGAGMWWAGTGRELQDMRPALLSLDHRVAQWFDRHSDPLVIVTMLYITELGSALMVTVTSIAVGVYLAARRAWKRLAVWLLLVPCGALFNEGLKLMFQRRRPLLPHAPLQLPDYSFPSGHSAAAVLLYGSAVVFLAARLGRRGGRAATAAAAVIVLAVGLSRMILGVHYLTDVVAGMTFGVAWLGVCLTAARRYA